jgi:hypothetical protein
MLTAEEARLLTRARLPHDSNCHLYLARSPTSGAAEARIGNRLAQLLKRALGARLQETVARKD